MSKCDDSKSLEKTFPDPADEKLDVEVGEVNDITLDATTDKRLLRKIDMYLCPVMMLVYAVQFMDKSTNATASVMGLRTDLHMEGNDYSWSGTAFYLGYLVFEFPAVYMLQRLPFIRTLSAFIVLWGVVLCLHATPNYPGFIALRTLLGMLESAVTPAFVIITSQWYKREEQFLRTSFWVGSNGLGIIVGCLMAYGLAINHHLPIHGWKLVFIITGVITIATGILILFHFPDDPSKAWFLTEEEKKLVVIRVRTNQGSFANKQFKRNQFIEAFKDPRSWLYFFYSIASNIPNGGITSFGSILFSETLGLGPVRGLLLQTPQGAVEIVGCVLFGLLAQYTQWRLFWSIVAQLIATVAMCLLAFLPHIQAAGLAGLYLLSVYPVGLVCMLSSVGSNTTGHTKKVTVNAIMLVGYCVGNIIGPQTFRADDAPEYVPAKVSMVVLFAVAVGLNTVLLFVNLAENKKRDREGHINPSLEELEEIQNSDMTDQENRYFRYVI
ncbi:major facilitator superfamily domain-containing protein [Yarrowia lipolytica]|uniref:Major facilitator superfamily domain-containing protein n=1 Tax=Yarrowia lipolytica TaxID=4952 RepID=A0A371C5N3_YARLL|nr:major facilitator superfamily domain-containing protein [Yarrowia lipolytica]RDW31914.1 major facilitator superfamily domain-containing protein [Yarrowia lipolytica]